MQNIIFAIIGIIFTMTAATQVMPNMIPYIQSQKAQNLSEQQIALFEAIKRYMLIHGKVPTEADLTENKLISSDMLKNSWDKEISYAVNESTGVVTITTGIPTEDGRKAFEKTWKNFFKPTLKSGTIDTFETSFVIPTDALHGNSSGIANGAIVSSSTPDATKYSFWYDTSGSSQPILKISDGTNWTAAPTNSGSGGWPAISDSNLSDATSQLPKTAALGTYKYIYNSATATIDTYVYYSNGWNLLTSINNTKGCLVFDSLLLNVSPVNGAIEVATNTKLVVTFNKNMNLASLNSYVTLNNSRSNLTSCTGSFANNIYTYSCNLTSLKTKTNYVINLGQNIADSNSVKMCSVPTASYSFTSK